MTIELDRAPLPPPSKRGRKPKAGTDSLAEWQTAIRSGFTSAEPSDDSWPSDNVVSYEGRETMPVDGWTGATEGKRFPPEGQDMLIGGYFNGQYRNMAEHSDERYACIGVEDDLRVEWYERCDKPGAWVWVASVYPDGIELRLTT